MRANTKALVEEGSRFFGIIFSRPMNGGSVEHTQKPGPHHVDGVGESGGGVLDLPAFRSPSYGVASFLSLCAVPADGLFFLKFIGLVSYG